MMKQLLFKIFVSKFGTHLDNALVRFTGWSLITNLVAVQQKMAYQPSLLFQTIGARTGEIRRCVLPYQRYGDRYFVVGSKAGAKTDPAWAINIRRNPSCWLYIDRRRVPARGYVAEGEERERLWQQLMDGGAQLYAEYQEKARPRILPIVVLEPLDGRPSGPTRIPARQPDGATER
ncbi:MAG: nitroreductase/quinone reductase family protein [Deltaproteobacteria bacterium]